MFRRRFCFCFACAALAAVVYFFLFAGTADRLRRGQAGQLHQRRGPDPEGELPRLPRRQEEVGQVRDDDLRESAVRRDRRRSRDPRQAGVERVALPDRDRRGAADAPAGQGRGGAEGQGRNHRPVDQGGGEDRPGVGPEGGHREGTPGAVAAARSAGRVPVPGDRQRPRVHPRTASDSWSAGTTN